MKNKSTTVYIGQLIVLMVMLFALYVSFWQQGLAVLPDIEHRLASRASSLFNATVKLHGTTGYLSNFKPHIRIAAIDVKTLDGRHLAVAEELHLSVNLWESLKSKTLIFDRITLDHAQLYLSESNEVMLSHLKPELQIQPIDQWLSLFLLQRKVWLKKVEIFVDSSQIHLTNVNQQADPESPGKVGLEADVLLDTGSFFSQGRLQAQIINGDDPFKQGRLSLQVEQLYQPSFDALPAAATSASDKSTPEMSPWFERLKALKSGHIWIDWDQFSVQKLQTQVRLGQSWKNNYLLQFQAENQPQHNGWNFDAQIQQGLYQSEISGQVLDLFDLKSYQLYSQIIPAAFASQLFELWNPRSRNVHLSGWFESLMLNSGEFNVELNDFNVSLPGFAAGPFNAALMTDFKKGVIRLDQGFLNLDWPHVLSAPLQNIELDENRLYFNVDHSSVFIGSRGFDFQHENANAVADWRVTFKNTEQFNPAFKPELEFLAEITSTTPNTYQRYLPRFLPEVFLTWMNQAIHKGHLQQGRILFHGKMKRMSQQFIDGFAGPSFMVDQQNTGFESDFALQPPPSLQMNFKGDELTFQFNENWPQIENARADVLVVQKRVAFDLLSGSSNGLDLKGRGDIIFFDDPYLNVQMGIQGQLKHGLEYLQQSPMGDRVDPVYSILDIQGGSIESNLHLQMQLNKKPLEPQVKVVTTLNNGQATLKAIDLPLRQVSGTAGFDLKQGLSAKGLYLNLLGQSFLLDIEPQPSETATRLKWIGEVSVQSLRDWLGWPLFNTMSGKTLIEGQLDLAPTRHPKLLLQSDLKGFSLNWPDGFGKKPADSRHWKLGILFDDSLYFDLYDENRYSARWSMKKNKIAGLDLKLGDTFTAGTHSDAAFDFRELKQGHRWNIELARVALDQWADFFSELQAPGPESAASNNTIGLQTRTLHYVPSSIKASIDELHYKQFNLGPFNLSMNEEPGGWRLQWDGPAAAGRGFIPKVKHEDLSPWRFHFDRFYWPGSVMDFNAEKSDSDDDASQSKQINYAWLGQPHWPSLSLTVNDIRFDEQFVGRAEIFGQPLVGGYSWNSIYGQFAGVHFRAHGHVSSIEGADLDFEIKGGRLDQAFELLSFDSIPLETSALDGRFNLDLPFRGQFAHQVQTHGHLRLQEGIVKGVNGLSPLKWLSLLNAEQLTRRLRLDFSGLTKEGLPFDHLDLSWSSRGAELSNSRLKLESPSLELITSGWVNFNTKELYQDCVAIIPVIDHLLLPAVAAGGLPAAATAYVLDKVLGDQLDSLTEIQWQVKGPWGSPEMIRKIPR